MTERLHSPLGGHNSPLITVIGRGHGGTRAMSHTLLASGVYIGNRLNDAGDKLPPEAMYDACRVLAKQVTWKGDLQWDFSRLQAMDIDPEFERLIDAYLADVLSHSARHRGWKIPETTLAYPWIVRMFPEARYIHWIRDPRDSIIRPHRTDDLHDFGIAYPLTDVERRRRAISWFYQYELMKSTPLPKHVIRFASRILSCIMSGSYVASRSSSGFRSPGSSCERSRSVGGKRMKTPCTASIFLKAQWPSKAISRRGRSVARVKHLAYSPRNCASCDRLDDHRQRVLKLLCVRAVSGKDDHLQVGVQVV